MNQFCAEGVTVHSLSQFLLEIAPFLSLLFFNQIHVPLCPETSFPAQRDSCHLFDGTTSLKGIAWQNCNKIATPLSNIPQHTMLYANFFRQYSLWNLLPSDQQTRLQPFSFMPGRITHLAITFRFQSSITSKQSNKEHQLQCHSLLWLGKDTEI